MTLCHDLPIKNTSGVGFGPARDPTSTADAGTPGRTRPDGPALAAGLAIRGVAGMLTTNYVSDHIDVPR